MEGKKILTASLLAASALTVPGFQMTPMSLVQDGLVQSASISRPGHLPGEMRAIPKRSTARALLKHAGTWAGDDLEKCLDEVYAYRGKAEF